MGWDNVLSVCVYCLLIALVPGLRFTIEPDDTVVGLYQSVLLSCHGVDVDNNTVQYRWMFNYVAELPLRNDHMIYSNGSLLIQRLTPDDIGEYLCILTTGEITLHSRVASLQLAYINPTFSIQPESKSVILGDNVTLSCYIESLPHSNITWTLDGINISRGMYYQDDNNGTSHLLLFPVMYHHAGTYKCVGTNQLTGVHRYSNDAVITVQGQPVFVSSPKSVTVPLKFEAKFVCDYYGNPEPQFTWLLHTLLDDGSVTSKKIQTSEKYRLYNNGTFIIHNVSKEDEGYYTCNVGNIYGEISMSASLTVSGEATPPVFISTLKNQTVIEHDKLSVLCECSGNPEPHIQWKKGMDLLSNNGSLFINNIQSEDTGWYTCTCENALTAVWQSIYIDVYVAPRILRYPQDIRVEKYNPLYLHCEAVGNPTPSTVWNTPRFSVVSKTSDGVKLHENGTLNIISSSLEDTGTYTCTVSNIAGNISASSEVIVEVSPEMTLLPISQGVTEGTSVYIHCQATSIPDPVYTWYKDNEAVTSTSTRQIFLNNTLAIYSVTKQDGGVYRCRAENIHGYKEAVATVTVNTPPKFMIVPENHTVIVGSRVQLKCLADGDPVPIQIWNYNDKQLIIAEEDNSMSLSNDHSELIINNITLPQYGKYSCIATNIAGTTEVSVWIELYDLPVFIIKPVNTIVNESSTLTLKCQGHAVEKPSVSWYKETSSGRQLIEDDERANIYDNGMLKIKSVQVDNDEGWYICMLTNSAGSISEKIFVNVQAPPSITFTNSPQSISEGSSVTLICQSSGDPTPDIQWTNPSGGVIQSSSAYMMTGSSLNIASINQNDGGNWTCQYCNQLGCDTEIIQIITEGLPVITSLTGSSDGSVFMLECEIYGVPKPTLTFSSQGHVMTSRLQGHLILQNVLIVEKEYRSVEYTCTGENSYGKVEESVSVPPQMEAPTVVAIDTNFVKLDITMSDDTDNLPFTKVVVQVSSGHDDIWKLAEGQGHTEILENLWKVTGLEPYTSYRFRVAAENILGTGQFSLPSPEIMTSAAAPSQPIGLVALELANNVVLLQWQPSEQLNGLIDDVIYEYRITKPIKVQDTDTTIVVVCKQDILYYNQTLQVRLTDLNDPVMYTAMIFARNIKINESSEPGMVSIDRTNIGVGIPEAEAHLNDKPFSTDKVIAIALGTVGGILFVIIVIFIVLRIRKQKKSESLSLVDKRLSLDQFYMESPKNLYNDTKYSSLRKSCSSLRKSCHSFYSFDQDDSFHSNNGNRDSLNGSVTLISKRKSCEVLLVSKNPTYEQKQNEGTGFMETAEIQIPSTECNIDDKDTVKNDNKHNVNRDFVEENNDIYGTIDKETSLPDTPLDHTYSSIKSGDPLLGNSVSSPPKKSKNKGGNSDFMKPSNEVTSLGETKYCDKEVLNAKGQSKWTNKLPIIRNLRVPSRKRTSRSESPENVTKGSNSASLKPPIRVLSLDQLGSNVEKAKSKEVKGESSLFIYADGSKSVQDKSNGNLDRKSFEKYNNKNVSCCDGTMEEYDSLSSFRTNQNSHNTHLNDDSTNENDSLKNGDKILTGDLNKKMGPDFNEKVDNSDSSCSKSNKPKNVIDDNFLTPEDIQREALSAQLY
ncbi:Immunoglobulin V-set domain [Mactra antiquata]